MTNNEILQVSEHEPIIGTHEYILKQIMKIQATGSVVKVQALPLELPDGQVGILVTRLPVGTEPIRQQQEHVQEVTGYPVGTSPEVRGNATGSRLAPHQVVPVVAKRWFSSAITVVSVVIGAIMTTALIAYSIMAAINGGNWINQNRGLSALIGISVLVMGVIFFSFYIKVKRINADSVMPTANYPAPARENPHNQYEREYGRNRYRNDGVLDESSGGY